MLACGPESPGRHVHVVTLKESVPSAICLQRKEVNTEGLRGAIMERGPKTLGLVIQNSSCQMTLRSSIGL